MRQLRTDIQVLRAVAVLSVLIFHFELPGLRKGYLGVDIFFVLSGYLMSRVIVQDMDEGRFSPAFFYFRRARRLLPAALATLTGVTLMAPWVLTASALRDYAWQLLGAVGFVANIVLWRQSGYFDSQAELKPLLHTWSLALEEQYYVVLPLVLGVLAGHRRRWRGWGLLLAAVASFAACQWQMGVDPSAAFYLLPTRAWELLIGSLCALPGVRDGLSARRSHGGAAVDPAWVALPVMGWCMAQGVDAVHPRVDALLVCLCTAALVSWPSSMLASQRPWMRPLHWVGDRSYALYLVHWPLMAFARHVWLQGVPPWLGGLLLPASLLLAHAGYHLIEQPLRHIDARRLFARRLAWILVALAFASAGLAVSLWRAGAAGQGASRQPNVGLSGLCDDESAFQPRPVCVSGARPDTLVWGDSFAMHLVPALLASPSRVELVQATRSGCAPVMGLARQVARDPSGRAAQCLAFNRSVMAYVRAQPQLRYVVLSARWSYFFEDGVRDAQGRPTRPTADRLARDMAQVVAALRAAGKRVVIVAPPPSLGPTVDLGLCGERRRQGLWTIVPKVDQDCGFALSEARRYQMPVKAMLDSAARLADVTVVDPADLSCAGGRCAGMLRGFPLYRDFGHLSVEGARALGQQWDLGHILKLGAR